MPVWMEYGVGLAALVVAAPLAAWVALRLGRSAKGGLVLASFMLGIGEAADPPSKHMIEAGTPEDREAPPAGDPPAP